MSLRLKQSQERKKSTHRYCATHGYHFNNVCPLCDEQQKKLGDVKNGR